MNEQRRDDSEQPFPDPDERADAPSEDERREQDEMIPLEPSDDDQKPSTGAAPERRSLLDESEDTCPSCGAPLPSPDAVVCVKCGYDLVANKARSTAIEEVEVDEADAEGDVFAKRAPLGANVPATIALVAWALAAILAGVFHEAGAAREIVRVLVYAPVQAGLGFGAVALTARLLEQKIGHMTVAAARIAMCVALFALMMVLGDGINAPGPVQFLVGAALGAGAYFLTAWRLFSTSPGVTGMLMGVHFVFWLLSEGLFLVITWLKAAPEAAQAAGAG